MYANQIEEVAESFIGLMQAPPPAPRYDGIHGYLNGRRWGKGAVAGLVCGLILGLGSYLAVANSGPTPRRVPAIEKVAEESPREVSKPEPRKESIPSWRKNIDRRNSKYRRLQAKGWRHYRRGNYRRSSAAFKKAIRTNPNRIDAYYGLAINLFEQGYESRALSVLRRGAKRSGPKSGFWVLAGVIHQWRGDESKARKLYRRYLKKNPRGSYARDVRVILSRERLLLPVPLK